MGFFDLFKSKKPIELEPASGAVDPRGPATACAGRIVDHVSLLHPTASGPVTIMLEGRDNSLMVKQTDVPAAVGDLLPASVVVEPALQTALLASDVAGLLRVLDRWTDAWFSVVLEVSRTSVSLLGTTLQVESSVLLFGDDFVGRMRSMDEAITTRQQVLQKAMADLGPCAVDWLRDDGVLRLTPKQGDGAPTDIPALVLGSYSPEQQSWCWAWANRSFDDAHREAVTTLRDRAANLDGGALLTAPGLDCTEPFAFAAAYLAASYLEDRPVFRWPLQSGVQLFFAMDPPDSWG